jgi:hypothetical protein
VKAASVGGLFSFQADSLREPRLSVMLHEGQQVTLTVSNALSTQRSQGRYNRTVITSPFSRREDDWGEQTCPRLYQSRLRSVALRKSARKRVAEPCR